MEQQHVTVADDLVIGARAIAAFLGTKERAVYHWANSSTLPIMFKIGGRLCVRRSTVVAWLDAQEGNCAAAAPSVAVGDGGPSLAPTGPES